MVAHSINSHVRILIGFPGSGKSTFSRYIKENSLTKNNIIILSRDDIRSMINGGTYIFDKNFEPIIKYMHDDMLKICLKKHYDVIIDETNFLRERRIELINIIKTINPNIYITGIVFDILLENCMNNRFKDTKGIPPENWIKIISDMWNQYEEPLLMEGFNEIINFQLTDEEQKDINKLTKKFEDLI